MINQTTITTRSAMLLGCFILMATNIFAQVKGVEGKDGKWGLVNSAGKMITPYTYQLMGNNGVFTEGLVAVVQNKKSGYIDTTGKVIIPLKYDECNVFKFGTATVWLGDFCGLIDKKGKLLIPIKFSSIDDSWNDSIVQVVVISDKLMMGLITRKGKELLPASYNEIGYLKNGITKIKQSDLYGFYNINTKLVIPCKYGEARDFTEGFAAVAINKKWGFIDVGGKIALPLEYDNVRPVENGHAEVRKNGVSSFVSKQLKTNTTPGGKDEFELVNGNQKSIPVPSTEREVIPGVISMQVPNYLKPQSGNLYGNISIYSDGYNFLYFKKEVNAIGGLMSMVPFRESKKKAGFSELGTIDYISPAKIGFVGFYGLEPDPLKRSDFTAEAYVFFNKPDGSRDCWMIHYKLGKESTAQIEKDIESFLKTVKLK